MRFLLLILVFGLNANAQTSYVPATRVLKQSGTQINLNLDYFSSSKTVDKDGETNSLAEGQSFARFQSEFGALYGLTDEFQLAGGLRYRQNQVRFTDTLNVDHTETSSGVQSTFLGFTYAFPKAEKLTFALEGQYRYTPYTNEAHSIIKPGQLVLGDDGNEYFGGLAATYASLGNNYFTLRGGYRRPGKDLSAEYYWQAEAALVWRHFALVAGVDGITSMKNDPYENDSSGRPLRNTGGSSLYNSSNRELIAPYAAMNFAIGKSWRVEMKASQVVSGVSTDLGTGFGINLVRRIEKIETRKLDKSFKTYDIEATVTKVSPKKEYVVIDKGITSDVEKGVRFDFYENDYLGGNVLVAIGTVVKVKSENAIVKITQRYNMKKELKEGLIGRAALK